MTIEQILLLSRGPSYVPPGQMHVSPSLNFNDLANTQMKPLLQQIHAFFNQYQIGISRKAGFLTELKRIFNQYFHVSLPNSIEQRATAERQLILSIRQQLERDQLILRRTADQMNLFYLANADEFHVQSQAYINRTSSFERISNMTQVKLEEICQSIDTSLLQLRQQSRIQENHLSKMSVKRINLALPHLYFLPESGQHDLPILHPIVSSCRYCPVKRLSTYLDGLLRPLYESNTQSVIVMNGMDFIGKLARFDEYSLLPQTIFATFNIINLFMNVSHDRIEEALGRFLTNALPGNRHQNLTIETIQQLVKLVLRNNIFTYDNHLYRFVKGSPLSLPLTRTLVNIYLHEWQGTLINQMNLQDEMYVRYHDHVFLAWQRSSERLEILLKELNQKHEDIHIDYTIGSCVHFLGVHIENQSGRLYTRVHRDLNQPRLTLPYVIGHPRLLYRQWYQWMLARAIRYCTSMEDFDFERINVEMTLLSNGFSLEFIQLSMNTFLKKYFAVDLLTSYDTRQYTVLRQRLFGLIQLDKQHYQKQQQWKWNNQIVHLQYLYDWGQRCKFNEQFRILWFTHVINDPILKNRDLKMKLRTVHCHPLNALLSRIK